MNGYFKVTISATGKYNISIGVGKVYSTHKLEEVKTALNHYFNHDSCWNGDNLDCPLCRAMHEEVKKTITSLS